MCRKSCTDSIYRVTGDLVTYPPKVINSNAIWKRDWGGKKFMAFRVLYKYMCLVVYKIIF